MFSVVRDRREHLVNMAVSFLGLNDYDGSYAKILNAYNCYTPHPRGYRAQRTDAWGCIFASAVAIVAGCTDIIPVECSCLEQMELFKKKNCWKAYEDEDYTPQLGDYVYFSWDNSNFPSQVGIITGFDESGKLMTVIMGNVGSSFTNGNEVKQKCVKIRPNQYILGYGTPRY